MRPLGPRRGAHGACTCPGPPLPRHASADIKFIDASIPRCTFVDTASSLTADITAGPSLLHRPGTAPLHHTGEVASAYVRGLQEEYPALQPLVLIIKALLRRSHYHEPFFGGLSSHGTVMMVVTMLKVIERDEGAEALAKYPLSVLLCEFLFLFGFEFDYAKTGISPKQGTFFDRIEVGDFVAPLLVEVRSGSPGVPGRARNPHVSWPRRIPSPRPPRTARWSM